MFTIRSKSNHEPITRTVTFNQEGEVGELPRTFATKEKAKHFLRNKNLKKKDYVIIFTTTKEKENMKKQKYTFEELPYKLRMKAITEFHEASEETCDIEDEGKQTIEMIVKELKSLGKMFDSEGEY